jgi:hypothetical protein
MSAVIRERMRELADEIATLSQEENPRLFERKRRALAAELRNLASANLDDLDQPCVRSEEWKDALCVPYTNRA